MKKLILAMTLVIILTGCTSFKDGTSRVSPSSSSIDSRENTSSSAPSADTSVPNANPDITTEFMALDNEDIRYYDFESAYEMCTQAITQYQSARKKGEKMDFSKYVENPKLISYLKTKLDSFYFFPQEYEVNKTGLVEFKVQQANSTGFDGDRAYLHIAYGVFNGASESSSSVKFIVKNLNGKLVIAEWYDDGKDTFDTICRGHLDINKDDIYWNTADIALLDKKIAEHIAQHAGH